MILYRQIFNEWLIDIKLSTYHHQPALHDDGIDRYKEKNLKEQKIIEIYNIGNWKISFCQVFSATFNVQVATEDETISRKLCLESFGRKYVWSSSRFHSCTLKHKLFSRS